MPPRRRFPTPTSQPGASAEGTSSADPNSLQHFVDLLAGALKSPSSTPTSSCKVTTFKDFKAVGPPEFKGTTNPIEAQNWIAEMEKVFEVAEVAENQKTVFAAFMLKGDANFWWQTNKIRGGAEIISWERFKEMFFEAYFPPGARNQLEVQFLELKQGEMTVSEYAAKFNELARFAPYQVNTDERRARRFEQGLRPWIYSRVSVLQVDSFAVLLEKALIAESSGEMVSNYNRERRLKSSELSRGQDSTSGKRRGNFDQPSSTAADESNSSGDKKRFRTCITCGKNHTGVCLLEKKNVCYACGQEGHIASNCPGARRSGCFNCGEVGHIAKFCPKKRMIEGKASMGSLSSGGSAQPN